MIKNVTKKDLESNPNLIVPLASDEIFYKVFGTEENVSNTEALISAFLGIPIKYLKGRVKIISRNMNNLTINSKNGEKDIVVWIDTTDHLKVNIEMNKYSTSNATINRNLFFLADVFSSGITAGTPYKDLVTSIQINFNPRYIDKENKPVIDKYTLKNDYLHELTNKFILYQINLEELSNIWYNKSIKDVSNIDPLIILFGALILENEKDKFKEIIKSNLISRDIKTSIERIVLDMNKDTFFVSHFYDREEARIEEWDAEMQEEKEKARTEGLAEGKIQGIEEGLKEGRKEGMKQKEQEIIKNLYKNNVPLELIHTVSNLTIDEIKKIIDEEQK